VVKGNVAPILFMVYRKRKETLFGGNSLA